MKSLYRTRIGEFYSRIKGYFESLYQSTKKDERKINSEGSKNLEEKIYRSRIIFRYPGSAISLFEGHFEKLKNKAKLLKPRS